MLASCGLIVMFFLVEASSTNCPSGTSRCTAVSSYSYTSSQSYSEAYHQKYYESCGLFGWKRCTRYRIRYRTKYRTSYKTGYRTTYRCCSGFTLIGSTCKPVCSYAGGCHNGGTCASPNCCECPPEYTGYKCQQPICSGGCQNGGTCTSPNTCNCQSGWKGSRCRQRIIVIDLTNEQAIHLRTFYSDLIDDMGGFYRPELLNDPQYYSRSLMPSLTPAQRQVISNSCIGPDIFVDEDAFDHQGDNGQLDDLDSSDRQKRHTDLSRLCSVDAPTQTHLLTISGTNELVELVHLDNHLQWVFSEECSSSNSDADLWSCHGVSRTIPAVVFNVQEAAVDSESSSVSATLKNVQIYSCVAVLDNH